MEVDCKNGALLFKLSAGHERSEYLVYKSLPILE